MLYKRENGWWYSVRVGKKIASFLPPYIHKFWTQNLSVAFFIWLKSSQNGLKHAPLNTQNITAMTFQSWLWSTYGLSLLLRLSCFRKLNRSQVLKRTRIDLYCNILISHTSHTLEHLIILESPNTEIVYLQQFSMLTCKIQVDSSKRNCATGFLLVDGENKCSVLAKSQYYRTLLRDSFKTRQPVDRHRRFGPVPASFYCSNNDNQPKLDGTNCQPGGWVLKSPLMFQNCVPSGN